MWRQERIPEMASARTCRDPDTLFSNSGGRRANGIQRCAAERMLVNVGQLDVFDRVIGDPAEDGTEPEMRVIACQVADEDSAHRADFGGFLWAAQASTSRTKMGPVTMSRIGDVRKSAMSSAERAISLLPSASPLQRRKRSWKS